MAALAGIFEVQTYKTQFVVSKCILFSWVVYHHFDGQTAKNIRIDQVHFSIRACRAFLGARLLRSSGPRCVSRESSTCLRRKAAISPPPLLARHFISLSQSTRRSCMLVCWRLLSFQVRLHGSSGIRIRYASAPISYEIRRKPFSCANPPTLCAFYCCTVCT